MFFNKKKNADKSEKTDKKKAKDGKQAAVECLSKEELQRLEDTKLRLFPNLGKKKVIFKN